MISRITTVALALLGAMTVNGAVTSYTTEGTFTTAADAAGDLSFTDNLNSYSSDAWPITLNNLSVTGGSLAFPNSNANTTVDGSNYLRLVTSNGTVTFTFNFAIIAFGFETNPQSGSGLNDTLGVTVGGQNSSFTTPATDVTEFRGFVSDTTFTTFTIAVNDGDSFYGFDNLVAYTAVPEPETHASLIVMCLLGIGAWLHRKKQPTSGCTPCRHG